MAELNRRQEYSIRGEWGHPPASLPFVEIGGKPAEPAMPDDLNKEELAQVNGWLDAFKQRVSASEFFNLAALEPMALAKIQQFRAYYESPEYLEWEATNLMAKDSYWRLRRADVHHAIEQATADGGGKEAIAALDHGSITAAAD